MSIFRVDGERLKGAAPLVEGWEETMLDSCLLGIMGEVYTDRLETLDAAQFLIGGFLFFCGRTKRRAGLQSSQTFRFCYYVRRRRRLAQTDRAGIWKAGEEGGKIRHEEGRGCL